MTKEERKAYAKAYYQAHKEEIKAKQKQKREEKKKPKYPYGAYEIIREWNDENYHYVMGRCLNVKSTFTYRVPHYTQLEYNAHVEAVRKGLHGIAHPEEEYDGSKFRIEDDLDPQYYPTPKWEYKFDEEGNPILPPKEEWGEPMPFPRQATMEK